MGRRALIRIFRRLCRRNIGGRAELTESLELVEKLVKDVETPVRNEIERFLLGGGSVLGCFFEDQIKELAVGVPAFDAVADFGAFDGLEVTEGDLVVEGEEELVSSAFVRDGFCGGPAGCWEVLTQFFDIGYKETSRQLVVSSRM